MCVHKPFIAIFTDNFRHAYAVEELVPVSFGTAESNRLGTSRVLDVRSDATTVFDLLPGHDLRSELGVGNRRGRGQNH